LNHLTSRPARPRSRGAVLFPLLVGDDRPALVPA